MNRCSPSLFENLLRRFWKRELQALSGRLVLLYPAASSLDSASPFDTCLVLFTVGYQVRLGLNFFFLCELWKDSLCFWIETQSLTWFKKHNWKSSFRQWFGPPTYFRESQKISYFYFIYLYFFNLNASLTFHTRFSKHKNTV